MDLTGLNDKLGAALLSKLEKNMPYRTDMYLADHLPISSDTAKILIGYNNQLGNLTKKDVEEFILASFDGKLTPDSTTIRGYTKNGAVSIIVSRYTASLPIDEKKSMIALSHNLYVDQKIQDTWEVRSNESGKYLSRVAKDDIDEIVKQRRKIMNVQARTVTFSNVGSSVNNVSEGSNITFYYGGTTHVGIVAHVDGEQVIAKSDGKTYKFNSVAIVRVNELSESDRTKVKNKLKDYFSQVYGPKYAAEMTKELVNE